MTCPAPEVLAAWIDGEVMREERERISAHVRQCGSCTRHADHLRALADCMRGLEFASPAPNFTAELAARLQHPSPRSGVTKRVAASVIGLGAVTLAAVLLHDRLDESAPAPGTFIARGGEASEAARVGFDVYTHAPGREPALLRPGQSLTADTGYSFVARNRSRRLMYVMLFALDAQREVHWFYPAFTEPTEDPRSILVPTGNAYSLPEGVTPDAPAPGAFRIVGVFSETPLSVREVEGLLRTGDLAALVQDQPTAVIQVLHAELRAPSRAEEPRP